MSDIFLTVGDVLLIHDLQIERFGGSPGVRDPGLLESAVEQARAGFAGVYLHEDRAAKASASLFSIVRNHPFIDGNQRTGLASALIFLDLNGIAIDHSSDLLYDATMAVVENRLPREDLAELFRRLSSSRG